MDQQTLETLGISQEDLRQRLVRRLAEELLASEGYDEWNTEPTDATLAARVPRQLTDGLRKSVKDAIAAEIARLGDAYAKPLVWQIMEAGIQPTNQYGEPKGDRMTVTELIADAARQYMETRVDRDGKVSSYRGGMIRLDWVVNEAVRKHVASKIEESIQDPKSTLAEALTDAVRRVLATFLADAKVSIVPGK
jgi:hypothetical protein